MTSNSLPVLAAEISRQHVMCIERGRAFVESAIEAGRLLIEAKELTSHGDWEAWLSANVPNVSTRTAQRYMRAARSAGEKRHVSLLSLRHVIRPKKKAKPASVPLPGPGLSADEAWEWAGRQVEAPFNSFDFEHVDCLRNKLMKQVGVPVVPDFLLGVHTKIPLLTLASESDLIETVNRLVPIAEGNGHLDIDFTSLSTRQAREITMMIENIAAAICGLVINELDRRSELASKKSPDVYRQQLQDEQAKVLSEWMAGIEHARNRNERLVETGNYKGFAKVEAHIPRRKDRDRREKGGAA